MRSASPMRPTPILAQHHQALALLLTMLMMLGTLVLTPRQAGAAPVTPLTVESRYDLTGDGLVSNADVMVVVNAWTNARESGSSCAGASPADINGDGCLSISDIQAMSARLGGATKRGRSKTPKTSTNLSGPDSMQLATANSMPFANPMIVVNSTGDAADATPDDGICATAGGVCTLRAAIITANRVSARIRSPSIFLVSVHTPSTQCNRAASPLGRDGRHDHQRLQPGRCIAQYRSGRLERGHQDSDRRPACDRQPDQHQRHHDHVAEQRHSRRQPAAPQALDLGLWPERARQRHRRIVRRHRRGRPALVRPDQRCRE